MQVLLALFYKILLYEDFLEHLDTFFHLFFGMCRHERKPHKGVLRCTSRRNDGIDEHAVVES